MTLAERRETLMAQKVAARNIAGAELVLSILHPDQADDERLRRALSDHKAAIFRLAILNERAK
jgi:hypothetical protein